MHIKQILCRSQAEITWQVGRYAIIAHACAGLHVAMIHTHYWGVSGQWSSSGAVVMVAKVEVWQLHVKTSPVTSSSVLMISRNACFFSRSAIDLHLSYGHGQCM